MKYDCDQCAYQTTRKDAIAQHKYTDHGEKSLECKVCDYKSFNKKTLKRHIQQHREKSLECTNCPYKTAVKKSLKGHIQIYRLDIAVTSVIGQL